MGEHEMEALTCNTHGVFIPEPGAGTGCPICRIEYWEERNHQDAVKATRNRLRSANIPYRFQLQTLESFKTQTQAQRNVLTTVQNFIYEFPDHYNAGRCITFIGGIGTGKTLLACCAIQTLVNTEYLTGDRREYHQGHFFNAQYTTSAEVVRTIRDTWDRNAKASTTDVLNDYVKVDLLVLDEVGSQVGTDSERSILFELLDMRYLKERPTLVISNCGQEGLTHALGERAIDRLRDHGGLLCVFNWPSWRK
jgi:DNA replication protein DnaC